MSDSPALPAALAPAPVRRGRRLVVAIVLASALVAAYALGEPTLPGLALGALFALALVGAWLVRSPWGAAAAVPVLVFSPQFLKVFAYELGVLAVAAVLLIDGLRRRSRALTRIDHIELAVAALLAWAMFTGFWCRDLWWFTFGVRKMGIGLLALWTAWRLGRRLGPDAMLDGIALGAFVLAGLTLVKAVAVGATSGGGPLSRTESTDLGWGTSNFIAALLVLMLPTVLTLTLQSARPAGRRLAWITLPMIACMVAVAASRGGAILFALGTMVFLLRQRLDRRHAALVVAAVVSIGLLIVGPGGSRMAQRFTSTREQGSAVIRLMLYREGWHRMQEHLPLGMGLGQGYGYPDRLNLEDPHNYWLVLGPELGVVGLALWVLVLVLLWRRASAYARDPVTRDLGRLLQLTIVLSQLNSLFEPTFQGLQYHFLFYWVAGAVLGGAAARRAAADGTTVSPA